MFTKNLSFSDFSSHFTVSRETYEKLVTYADTLTHWQKSINLISPNTISQLWMRHIVDSYQMVSHIPSGTYVTDIGSGAGLPGIILAIAGFPVTLVESDGKKAAFLREACRILRVTATIKQARAESITIEENQLITARAFSSILTLLKTLQNTLSSRHTIMLLKGKTYDQELNDAKNEYLMDSQIIPSITDPESALVILSNVQPRGKHL